MEEEQPKKKRIGLGMGIALLLVAIGFDVLGIVATAIAPAVGGIVVDCIGVLVFLPWFYLLNVSLISPKQLIQWILNMGADFGTVGVWFGFTLGTILTLIVVYFEDKTHIPVTALVPGRNMGQKVLRRIQDPKRAIAAQQRLARMSRATRAKISGAQRFSFQDTRVPNTNAIGEKVGLGGAKKEFVNLNALKRETPEKYLSWDEKRLAIAQNKLARREANPEKALLAEERLERRNQAWQEGLRDGSKKAVFKDLRPIPSSDSVKNETRRAA